MAVTAGASWGGREANRGVYIGNREDRGTEVPRPRKSRGFSPNRLPPDQRIEVSSRSIEEDGGREQDRDDQIELLPPSSTAFQTRISPHCSCASRSSPPLSRTQPGHAIENHSE